MEKNIKFLESEISVKNSTGRSKILTEQVKMQLDKPKTQLDESKRQLDKSKHNWTSRELNYIKKEIVGPLSTSIECRLGPAPLYLHLNVEWDHS